MAKKQTKKQEALAFFSEGFKKATFNQKIVEFTSVDVGNGEMWPGVKLGNGTLLIFQQDAEGNGAGAAVAVKGDKTLGMATGRY